MRDWWWRTRRSVKEFLKVGSMMTGLLFMLLCMVGYFLLPLAIVVWIVASLV